MKPDKVPALRAVTYHCTNIKTTLKKKQLLHRNILCKLNENYISGYLNLKQIGFRSYRL